MKPLSAERLLFLFIVGLAIFILLLFIFTGYTYYEFMDALDLGWGNIKEILWGWIMDWKVSGILFLLWVSFIIILTYWIAFKSGHKSGLKEGYIEGRKDVKNDNR